MNANRRFWLPALAWVLAALGPGPVVGAAPPGTAPARVLHINSYHRGYAWGDEVERGLMTVLAASGREIEVSVEYLDSRRFPDAATSGAIGTALADVMAAKYQGYHLDLVVVSDNAAFDFAVRHRDRLFPGLPLVFCGYNNFRPEVLNGIGNATGVNEEVDLSLSIELALGLHPRTRTLAFILSSADPSSRRSAESAEVQILPRYRDRYDLVVLKDAPMTEIRARLADLPPESLVFLAGQTSDQGEGRALTPEENGRLIADASLVPVYSFWDFHLGTGVLGGAVLTGVDQGRTAADLALRILGGTPAAALPVVMAAPTTALFDFPVMERFGLRPAALPVGSVVLNAPTSFWARYRWQALAILGVLALQALSILALARVVRQRRCALNALAVERGQLEDRVRGRTIDLQQALAELRGSEARFRSFFELPLIGSAITSPEQGWLEVNAGLCTMLGYSEQELTGLTWSALTHPDDVAADLAQFERLLRGEIDTYALEKRFVCKDGGIIWVELSVGCVRRADGAVEYLVALLQDITERRLADEAMAQARALAEAANRQKGEFLANMSHEIRTPMNAVIGLTQLLMDTRLDAHQQDYLRKIHASSKALLRILNDILDYSKIDAGALDLERADFRLRGVLDGVLALFGVSAGEKGVSLDVEIAPEVPPVLFGDALRLGQILNNLVGNAVKFTRQGRVEVRVTLVERRDCQVRLAFAVRDTGIGLTDEEIQRLFQPFTQADGSITRRFGGTGLGLTICRRLVVLMGGEISVEASPGQGATFRFTVVLGMGSLPAVAAEPRLSFAALHDQATPIRGARVLLVEDDAVSRQVARAFLQRAGLVVDLATDGAAAVARVAETHYDLVLMDLQMPGMDGLAATRCIRAAPGHQPPILAMTAAAMRQDREAALAAGMNDHIAKPIERDELLAALLRWIPAGEGAVIPDAAQPPMTAPAPALDTAQPAVLDLAALTRRLGGSEAVPMILETFTEDFRDAAGTLETLVAAGDMKAALGLAHRLRGAAGNIGADALQAAAKALELGLGRGDTLALVPLTGALASVLGAIDDLSAAREATPVLAVGPEAAPDLDGLTAGLRQLAAHLDSYRLVPETLLAELRQGLAGRVPAACLETLARQIERFDYGSARATLRDITAGLDASQGAAP